ncbi:MAG: WYL domain-containing protein [Lachnospiraceae bacterium]|nr:WYL domain-containing protein [Lachnospiraceae bacterium]
MRTKEFELSEVKMLMDLVTYSKFMEVEFSKEIVDKLKLLLNQYELEVIQSNEHYPIFDKNTKTINQEVLHNIEEISLSMRRKEKIEFDYYKYGLDKRLHKQGENRVSAYGILCENEFYYLIGYNERYNDYSFFRLDRIKNIKHMQAAYIKPKQPIKEFIESSVYMFGGEKEKVELKCDIRILDGVLEKFGKNIEIQKLNDDYFKAKLEVNLKGLKMWIMQYIEFVEVLTPKILKEELLTILQEAIKRYNNQI